MAANQRKQVVTGSSAACGGWVCGEEALPADFGKISMESDPNFRPLTAADLKGFSEQDWKDIESEMERAPNEQRSATADEGGSDAG